MWQLLKAELSGRLRILASWCSFVLIGVVGLLLITQPGVPVLRWAVTTLVGLPVIANLIASADESTQERRYRQVTLPVTRRQIGLVWLAVPMAVQCLGGGLAVAVAFGQQVWDGNTNAWISPMLLTCFLLLAGQWYSLQRELMLRGIEGRVWSMTTGLVSTMAVISLVAGGYFVVQSANERWGNPLAWSTWAHLSFQFILLAVALVILRINLHLYLKRDAIAL